MSPSATPPSTPLLGTNSRVHISLLVRDLAASTRFYATLFGCAPSKARRDYANWRLDAPAIHLAINHDPEREATSTKQHFGIEIESDETLDRWGARLDAAGLEPRREDQVTCCYAVANKYWVKDPDGNDWELWVRHEDAETMHGDRPMAPNINGACGPSAADEDC